VGWKGGSGSDRITVVAAGSSMFTTHLRTVRDPGFHDLLAVVRTADAAFLNLEAPIREPASYPVKQYIYTSYVTSEPWVTGEIRWAGFNMASIANNHMADWSPESIQLNRRLLEEAGIAFSGAGASLAEARAPGYLDTERGRVALISVDSSYEYGQFSHVQMASDPHGGVPARPGTNGLRWDTRYELDPDSYEALRRIHRSLGLHREGMETTHTGFHPRGDGIRLRGVTVRPGERPRVRTWCRQSDLDEILRWVRSARAQADYLLVSHHNHAAAGEDWELPADFVTQFAHAVVDAGADAYIGHGYTSKGVEVYRGRPILYDIGDWSTQDASARRHPGDAYAHWGLGPLATPGEFADARERARAHARETVADEELRLAVRAYSTAANSSALVRFAFADGELAGLELHPTIPASDPLRHRRGLPTRATGAGAGAVLERFARASASFGTRIEARDGVGHVVLDPGPG
jgi:poly-gamma-glutamate capsule biosynthesis protein CapA/YwtB (metallophosphatase superfamily)